MTGGASGLGLAVAERLVELGALVVVLDLRPSTCSGGSRSPSAVPGSPIAGGWWAGKGRWRWRISRASSRSI
ncbi:MAG: hypothetical protein ACREXX_17715 [Gammaproteobacteria bacterium]